MSKSSYEKILKSSSTIAIVGVSNNSEKDSYKVMKYLLQKGYEIFPVNPKYDYILETKCYPDLSSIPEPVDIVDIFRRPEHVMPFVEDAIKIRAKVVWMQLGIINQEAANLARVAGLEVIMDHCIKIEHQKAF
jgi:predicted CoA-binding protein